MTSQVSSPAEKADGSDGAEGAESADAAHDTVVGEQRSTPGRRASDKEVRRLDRVIIRFAGDSGDGMQLTGDRFTSETAAFGNDLSTLP
ncbi:2-oxoacid:acceptor oxidoreductase subunit alpha, partial [Streptomyces chryseus]